MTLHLPKELERFVHEAVRVGRYAREDDVICDALTRLKESLPQAAAATGRRTRRAKTAKAAEPKALLTLDQVHQRMIASGLITQLPDPAQDIDDDDVPPIVIKGEPLSETIIRERR